MVKFEKPEQVVADLDEHAFTQPRRLDICRHEL
jgi:hypothetical protein